MKILFVDPPFTFWQFTDKAFLPKLSLVAVGTFLRHKGHEVEILDMNAEKMDYEELPSKIKKISPNIVGVPSDMACHVPFSLKVAEIVKKTNPEIVTIGGGINMSLMSERILGDSPYLDFIVRNDGEYTSQELIEALEAGKRDFSSVKGITWRKDWEIFSNPKPPPVSAAKESEIISNPERPPIMDLDSLPLLDWDLIDFDKYNMDFLPPEWGPQALLTISRGCPHNCRFCTPSTAAQAYREMSAERALEEFKLLRWKYGRRMIWLFDLTFAVNEENTVRLLEGLIREKLDLNLYVFLRTDLTLQRKNILPLMRRAGVRIASLGVESPLEKDHREMGKFKPGTEVKRIRKTTKEAFKLLHKNDISISATYMWGDVNHTPEDVRRIWKFAAEADAEVSTFCFITPYPGTPYYEKRKDQLLTEDLSYFSEDNPVLKNPYMSPDQMRILQQEMHAYYFIRWGRLIKHLLFGREDIKALYRTLARAWRFHAPKLRQMWEERFEEFDIEEMEKNRGWARKLLKVPPQKRAMDRIIWFLARKFS